jgi:hypothetical protein
MAETNNSHHTPTIGVTERGDGGLDLSWANALKRGRVDAAIVITKNLTKRCLDEILELTQLGHKVAVHVGCTGWGSSWLEPNVPTPETQIASLTKLLDSGFDNRRVTLRIDPIVPTAEGLERAAHVLELARPILTSDRPIRIRMSVLDEYRHVKDRLRTMGREPFYEGNRFRATNAQFADVVRTLDAHTPKRHGRKTIIETCAEPALVKMAASMSLENTRLVANGCVSRVDFQALDLPTNTLPSTKNGQGRGGCMCLTCKRELLSAKKQCPHKCVYCYWRN